MTPETPPTVLKLVTLFTRLGTGGLGPDLEDVRAGALKLAARFL